MSTPLTLKRPPRVTSPATISALLSSESSRFEYRLCRSAKYTPALNAARVIASKSTYQSVRRTRMGRSRRISLAGGDAVACSTDSVNELWLGSLEHLFAQVVHVAVNLQPDPV